MKTYQFPALLLCSSLLIFSCSNNNEKNKYSDAEKTFDASADSTLLLDSTRQYKQSGYLKMQVAKVQETKKEIRNIIKKQKGFILSSVLNNEIQSSRTIAISQDSSKEIKLIAVSNSYSLKVPVQNLDSTITALESQGIHIDESSQEAEDVSPIWLTSREDDNIDNETIAQLQKSKNGIDNIQMQYGIKKEKNASLNNSREMQYQIRYCDLKVYIYQSAIIQTSILVNTDSYYSEKSPFSYSIKNALLDGFYLFQDLIIGLTHLWLIILVLILGILIWRRYRTKKRLVKS